MSSNLQVRAATIADAASLAALLNVIIARGGTTALETPYSAARLTAAYIDGPNCISCFIATDDLGAAGFQLLHRIPELPADCADIGTFVRQQPRATRVGSALFPVTRDFARTAGFAAINATIRADNVGGLAYYDGLGFDTWRIDAGVPLRDGTPVDRIWKRYDMG